MKIKTKIEPQTLKRTIENLTCTAEYIFACAILLSFEETQFTKVQYNLRSENGSLHLEYREGVLSYYYRKNFSFTAPCSMSVSVISELSNAYSSHVCSESSLNVFQEFLRVSDQRNSILLISSNEVTRCDTLPPTKFTERAIVLPSASITVFEIK